MSFIINQGMLDKLADSSSTMSVNGEPTAVGSEIVAGDRVVILAGAGYEFKLDELGKVHAALLFFDNQGREKLEYFTLDEANKVAVIESAVLSKISAWDSDYCELYLEMVQVVTEYKLETNRVYSINSDQLRQINNDRFVVQGLGSGEGVEFLDYGNFILSVLKLPFAIPEDSFLEPELIKLGVKETTVSAPLLNTDNLTVSLGEIYTPMVSDNLLDFVNASAFLYLPYSPAINIDIDFVMGKTISIFYDVDLYSGDSTVRVLDSDGNLILLNKLDLSIKVPYAQRVIDGASTIANNSVILGGDNDIRNAYVEILQNDAILSDGLFTVPIIDEKVLTGEFGFIKVEEIDLQVNASFSEKDLILNTLKYGVIIK